MGAVSRCVWCGGLHLVVRIDVTFPRPDPTLAARPRQLTSLQPGAGQMPGFLLRVTWGLGPVCSEKPPNLDICVSSYCQLGYNTPGVPSSCPRV